MPLAALELRLLLTASVFCPTPKNDASNILVHRPKSEQLGQG